jgi:hypothetical protein
MCERRSTVKLAVMTAACLLSQGCVGIAIKSSTTKEFGQPRIATRPSIGAVSEAGVGDTKVTATWLREYWGEPATIRSVSPQTQTERWTYKFSPMWYGIMPCVVIPVPLYLPLAKERVVFMLKEGCVVSARVVTSHDSGTGASLLGPEGPFTW